MDVNKIELPAATGKAESSTDRPALAAEAASYEIMLHELGASVAASVAAMQQELASYPTTLGAFVVGEIALDFPVSMRIDELGQVLATVLPGDNPSPTAGKLHLSIQPVLGQTQPPPVNSGQSLAALGALSPEAIGELEARHIYTVDDLLRVAGTGLGRSRLERMRLVDSLDGVLEVGILVSTPLLLPGIGRALVAVGVKSLADFVNRNPAELAEQLNAQLGYKVLPETVMEWQHAITGQ